MLKQSDPSKEDSGDSMLSLKSLLWKLQREKQVRSRKNKQEVKTMGGREKAIPKDKECSR